MDCGVFHAVADMLIYDHDVELRLRDTTKLRGMVLYYSNHRLSVAYGYVSWWSQV